MNYNKFVSPAGTPHKIPTPTKKQNECKHERLCSYSFDMMKPPFCQDCGKPVEGERAEQSLKLYKSIIDDHNRDAEKRYEEYGFASFYIKTIDGSYTLEYRNKPKSKNLLLQFLEVFR
jgi:hypothetical protein